MGFKRGRVASGTPDAEKEGEAKPGPRWFWLRKAGGKRTLPGNAARSRLGTPLTAESLEPSSPSQRSRCRPGTPFRASMARFSPGGSAIQQLHAELAAGRHTAGLARATSGGSSRSSPPQGPRSRLPGANLQNSRSGGARPHTSPHLADWEQRECRGEGGPPGGHPMPPLAGVIQRRRAVAARLQALSALQRGSAGVTAPVSRSSPLHPDHAARLARLFFLAGPPAYSRRMQEASQADPQGTPESPLICARHLRSQHLADLFSEGPQPGLGDRSPSLDSAQDPAAQQCSLLSTPSRLGGGSEPWQRLSLGESEHSADTAGGSKGPPPHRARLSSGEAEEPEQSRTMAHSSKASPGQRRRLPSGDSEESEESAASAGSMEDLPRGPELSSARGLPLSSHALATLKFSTSADTDSLDAVPLLQLSRTVDPSELTAHLQQELEQPAQHSRRAQGPQPAGSRQAAEQAPCSPALEEDGVLFSGFELLETRQALRLHSRAGPADDGAEPEHQEQLQQSVGLGVCRCEQPSAALVDAVTQTPEHPLWHLNPAFAGLAELEEGGEGLGTALPLLRRPGGPADSLLAAPTESAFLSSVSHPDTGPDSFSTSFFSTATFSEGRAGSPAQPHPEPQQQPEDWAQSIDRQPQDEPRQQPEDREEGTDCQPQAEDDIEPPRRSSLAYASVAGRAWQAHEAAGGAASPSTTQQELPEQGLRRSSSGPTPHRTGLAGTWRLVEPGADPGASHGAGPGAGRAAVERLLAIPRLQSLAYARTRALDITETDTHLDIVRLVSLSGPAVIRERHSLRKDGGVTEGPRLDARPGLLRSHLNMTPEGHVHIRSEQGPPHPAVLHERLRLVASKTLSPRLQWEQRVQLLGSSGQSPDDAATVSTLRTWQRQP